MRESKTKVESFETVKTAIGTLHTAQSIAKRFFLHVPTILSLADGGFIPHYRVKGIEQPLFEVNETKAWVASNLVEHVEGEKLPAPKIFVVKDQDFCSVIETAPANIASVQGLRQYNPELFTGIYFMCLKNEVVYVGQSTSVPGRLKQHGDSKEYDRVYFVRVASEQLNEVENRFIKALNPKYNRQSKIQRPKETKAAA